MSTGSLAGDISWERAGFPAGCCLGSSGVAMVLERIGLGDGFFDCFGVALPLGGGGGGMREDFSAGRSGWDRPEHGAGADIFFS